MSFKKLINKEDIPLIETKMKFPSKEQFESEKPQFALLEADDYELQIAEVKPDIRKKYQSKEDEPIVDITFKIKGYKGGGEVKDKEGLPAEGRKVFFTIRPESMGFQSDGTPSKSRALLARAFGQDPNDELEIENWEDLIDKIVYAEVVIYQNAKGQERNKIARFLAPPRGK